MQEACDEVDSGMLTLRIFFASRLNLAIECALAYCKRKLQMENPVLQTANYLGIEHKVIAGHDQVCYQ